MDVATTSPTPVTGAAASTTDRRPTAVASLQALTSGRVVSATDHDWDTARMPWNVAIDQRPLAVLEAADVADVAAAVRWAADHGVAVAAQPTGHGATGNVDRLLVIRTGALDSIEIDLDARTATVGSGVRAGDLLRALDGTGLTYLAGSSPGPTVVGMTLTGGVSWFGRRFGTGADSVRSVELVDGLGQVRRITAEQPELFFAVRGAGGDFGIVTRVEIALHAAPSIHGGRMMWPVEHMGDVLRAFGDVTAVAPPELTVWFQLLNVPPLPEIPEFLRGRSFAIAAYAFLGDGDDAKSLMAPFHAIDGCLMDTSGPVALADLGALADDPVDPSPVHERGRLLTHLDGALIDRLVTELGAGSAPVLTMVQIRHLGGAFAERTFGPRSAFGRVDEPYQLFALGVVPFAEAAPAVDGALERLLATVGPWSTGRSMLAFLGPDSTDRWWDESTRSRLVAVKGELDPHGIVRSNRPVAAR